MTYLQDTLLPNETVLLETKTSMWLLTKPALMVVICFGLVFYMANNPIQGIPDAWIGLLAIIWMVMLFALFNKHSKYSHSEFWVTNKRVVIKQWVLEKNTNEINYNQIDGVIIHQSFFGKIVNFWEITIKFVAESGTVSAVSFVVNNPLLVRWKIYENIPAK